MVMAFFDSHRIIYTNHVPRGTTVNANYIREALGKFMKIFRKKRLVIAERMIFPSGGRCPGPHYHRGPGLVGGRRSSAH